MTSSSVSGIKLASFKVENYQQMCHVPHLVKCMDTCFYATHNFVNIRDIVKHWVNGSSKLRMTPNHVYKTKSLRKAYQFLIIFACQLYGQEITKTFLENWVVMLDQLVSDGNPFNCLYLLVLQLKVLVTNAQNLPKDEQAIFYKST